MTLGAARLILPSVDIPPEGTMTGEQYRLRVLNVFNEHRKATQLPTLSPEDLGLGTVEPIASTD
jgi:hypothetical protein